MRETVRRVLFCCTALLLAAAPGAAQQDVPPGQAVTVLRLNDLSLGTVLAGTTVVVQPTDPSAGRYSLESRPNLSLRVVFTLPAALQAGAHTVPVTFGPTSAAWSTLNNPAAAERFDPRSGFTARMPNSRMIYVWLGAQAALPAMQAAGTYEGTVTLTVVHN